MVFDPGDRAVEVSPIEWTTWGAGRDDRAISQTPSLETSGYPVGGRVEEERGKWGSGIKGRKIVVEGDREGLSHARHGGKA